MPASLDVGNQERASVICAELHRIFVRLEDLVRLADREVEVQEQALAFRQAIGSVCGALVLDVLAPLYREYPALKPDSWPEDV